MRKSLIVPVHSRDISAELVASDLREHGFVVVETMRTVAQRVATEVHVLLGIDPESERGPNLIHLSQEVRFADPMDNRGWVDFLIYDDAINTLYKHRTRILIEAMRQWLAAGGPDRYLTRVTVIN